MKITFVLPNASMSGGIRVVAIYADRLQRRGHQVTLVSVPRKVPRLRARVKSALLGRGWPGRRQQAPSHLDGLDVPHRVLDRWRPIVDADLPDADVVVATWWQTAEWVAGLSAGKGAKAYFVQGHEVLAGQPAARVKATYRLPLHKITISRWLVDLMRDTYGDPISSHVPNSVDTRQFHAPARGKQRRPTVGMLFNSMPSKGCDVSLRALELARQQLGAVALVSFGAESPEGARPLPADTTFVLDPAQDRLRELYAACDVWICGSRSEGFHLPPLEAMACRCPVVSTRVGGPLDVIDGRNGRLVDLEDWQGLGRALVEVLSLPEPGWRAMSDAALATATGYTWDDATVLFEAGLLAALERQRPRPAAGVQIAAQTGDR
jgi:glycosyltransferase involved in cell wall biosynthesis